MAMTREEAKALAGKVLSASKAPECQVAVTAERAAHTRFAANDVTTSGATDDLTITITSRGAGRSGTVTGDETSAEALKKAVARSEELMALAPVDPEFVEGLGPQEYAEIPAAFDEPTAQTGPAERAAGVKIALEKARGAKLAASGLFETTARWSAIATKKGLFGFHRATQASYSTTMRTDDGTGSGWAGLGSARVSEIAAAELTARAARKADSSRSPKALDPGKYTVILEPRAVADLLGQLGFALSARNAEEGRSYFSKPGGGTLVGEKVFHESVTIASDPFDSRAPGVPWVTGGGFGPGGGFAVSSWGLPARKTVWVEAGVLKSVSIDRYWGKKTKREPVPPATSIVMAGGAGSVDDLVAGCERGLLVTRFWYIRPVNQQRLLMTGLTRDGVWLVEKGKVVGPVNNFRFNESPGALLKNVEALSAPVSTGTMVVPAIRAKEFTMSSKSDAV
jgi:predicted Zn-dependent protease